MTEDSVIGFIENECLPNFTIIEEFDLTYRIKRTFEGGVIYFSNENKCINFEVHIIIRECLVDAVFYSENLGIKRKTLGRFFKEITSPDEVDLNLNFPKIDRKSLFKLKKDFFRQQCGSYLVQCCSVYNDSIRLALGYYLRKLN